MQRYNKTIVQSLPHYVAENQRDLIRYVDLITYAYKTQVHRTTTKTPSNLVLTMHPPSIHVPSVPSVNLSKYGDKCMTSAQFKEVVFRKLAEDLKEVATKSDATQRRYKADVNKEIRTRIVVNVGDEVFLTAHCLNNGTESMTENDWKKIKISLRS